MDDSGKQAHKLRALSINIHGHQVSQLIADRASDLITKGEDLVVGHFRGQLTESFKREAAHPQAAPISRCFQKRGHQRGNLPYNKHTTSHMCTSYVICDAHKWGHKVPKGPPLAHAFMSTGILARTLEEPAEKHLTGPRQTSTCASMSFEASGEEAAGDEEPAAATCCNPLPPMKERTSPSAARFDWR